jgi:hypothetical protein
MGDAAALGHSSNTSIKTSQKPEPAVKQTLGAHEQAVVDPASDAPFWAGRDRTWERRSARVLCVFVSIGSVRVIWASSTVCGHRERRADLAHPRLAQAADAFDEQRHGH